MKIWISLALCKFKIKWKSLEKLECDENAFSFADIFSHSHENFSTSHPNVNRLKSAFDDKKNSILFLHHPGGA